MITVHGHFYQPPRENPWTGEIDAQPSAAPYHDWNERIDAECYGPNGAARILRGDRVAEVVNNYQAISFNFGPTLIDWLEKHAPWTYERVIAASRNAIAQAYNHAIMPLLNARDKKTQVIWGLRNFKRHFGRDATGMWLPECAVDTASLEALAAEGVRFTILSPRSGKSGIVRLPSGKSITVFVYDGPLSQAIAFEGLLKDGAKLAEHLKTDACTDGETYGHHHTFGEMALAFASKRVKLVPYNERSLTNETRIVEETSWSCEHGIERWRSDCGCRGGRHGHIGQPWRGPLRAALDFLRDAMAEDFDKRGSWADRDKYDGHDEPLYEAQRYAMYMYTSCGWFFDDLADLETRQVLAYAARALELSGVDVRAEFLNRLEEAKSALGKYSARDVFLETEATQSLPVRMRQWAEAPRDRVAMERVLESVRHAKIGDEELRKLQALYQESGATLIALAERLGF